MHKVAQHVSQVHLVRAVFPKRNDDRTEDDFNQYEVVDMIARYAVLDHTHDTPGHQLTEVNGKPKFSRLIIRKKNIINELKKVS